MKLLPDSSSAKIEKFPDCMKMQINTKEFKSWYLRRSHR